MNWALSGLVNGLLVSAPLTAAVWLLLFFASRRGWNAATRYVVWWITLSAVVMLPLAYLPVTVFQFVARPALPPVLAGPGVGTAGSIGIAVTQTETVIARSLTPGAIQSRSSDSLFPVQVTSGRWAVWVLMSWAATSALLLLRLTVSYVLLERRKRRAESASTHKTRLEEWLTRRRAGQRQVRVRVSSEIAVPMAAGPYDPVILIPERMMDQLDENDLIQIGLHEAAHFSRRDDYMLLVQRVIEAVFVFHPFVRWIARRIELEREIACDDCVIQATGNPRSYAACLTQVMELSGGVLPSRLAAPTTERASQLETRIEMLLDDGRKTTTHVLRPRLTGAVVILFAMVWMAAVAPGPVLFSTRTRAVLQSPPEAVTSPIASQSIAPAVLAQTPVARQIQRTSDPVQSTASLVFAQTSIAQQAPKPSGPGTAAVTTPNPRAVLRLTVVVTERLGRYVSGLEKEHFKLFEDDVEQNIAEFSSNGALSLALVYAIRNGNLGSGVLGETIAQFQRMSTVDDEFWVIYGSNAGPESVRVDQSDGALDEVLKRLDSAKSVPPLPGEILTAVELMKSAKNSRRAVVIVSDVNDRAALNIQDQITGIANKAGAQIYALSMTPRDAATDSVAGEVSGLSWLDAITKQTGGIHFSGPGATEVLDVLTKIGVGLRNTYQIGFTPTNIATDGAYRRVLVEVLPPRGIQNLFARSQLGYFAINQGR